MAKAQKSHGSNLTFPSPKQSITVKQKKDTMAMNVGGSAHMGPKAGSGGKHMSTGGKKHKEKF